MCYHSCKTLDLLAIMLSSRITSTYLGQVVDVEAYVHIGMMLLVLFSCECEAMVSDSMSMSRRRVTCSPSIGFFSLLQKSKFRFSDYSPENAR